MLREVKGRSIYKIRNQQAAGSNPIAGSSKIKHLRLFCGCFVSFYPDGREVQYQREDITELDLAYAITIHMSQGSKFETVIIPVLTQHFKMLFRNLIYIGLIRARKLAVFVGTRKALAMAVRNQDTSKRQTALRELIMSGIGH